MTERKRFAGRTAAFFALSFVFFLPAIERLWSLSAIGAVRRVDIVLILAGGFAAGALFAVGMRAWRDKR
jgi:hypothetical protein